MKRQFSLLCLLLCLWIQELSAATSTESTFPNVSEASQPDTGAPVLEHDTTILPVPENDPVKQGAKFMFSKRKPSSFGWDQETHRALTTLALSGALATLDHDGTDYKLMVKELELKLALAIAKQHQEELTAGQAALYINALMALCHNPRDFYGLNVVSRLLHHQDSNSAYTYGLQSLALCNAGVRFDKTRVLHLIENIKYDQSDLSHSIDSVAMVTLALACGQKHHSMHHTERYLRRTVRVIKKVQKPDGSFGNIYSSAIALQALIAAETDDRNWNRSQAIDYILSQQREDGSFVDFMGTYFALPPLVNTTFASLADWRCPKVATTEDTLEGEVNTPGGVINGTDISVKILVRAPETQEYRVDLKGIEKQNLYTIIKDNDDLLSVEFKDTAYGHMIIGVDGINQDPSRHKYWMIYYVDDKHKETPTTTGVDGIVPADGDHYVFDLKTFS